MSQQQEFFFFGGSATDQPPEQIIGSMQGISSEESFGSHTVGELVAANIPQIINRRSLATSSYAVAQVQH